MLPVSLKWCLARVTNVNSHKLAIIWACLSWRHDVTEGVLFLISRQCYAESSFFISCIAPIVFGKQLINFIEFYSIV